MPNIALSDLKPHQRTREWVESCVRYESHPGVHTYHACACGRGMCRAG